MSLDALITNSVVNEFKRQLSANQFWKVYDENNKEIALFDRLTHDLWDGVSDVNTYSYLDANKRSEQINSMQLPEWKVPSYYQLNEFTINRLNPYRSGACNRLFSIYGFIYDSGYSDVDSTPISISDGSVNPARVVFVNKEFENKTINLFIKKLIVSKLYLSINNEKIEPSRLIESTYKNLDYSSVRLPKLDDISLTDPNKGLWEFHGDEYQEGIKQLGIQSRDPAQDVKKGVYVAIDFGTSSTVVAYEDQNQHKLLRIGVRDFYAEPKASHYENPTVLEFLNIPSLLEQWSKDTYRPNVSWDDVRCSHEAQANFRDNEGDSKVLASILPKMKQWALRSAENDAMTRITDRENGEEHILSPLEAKELSDLTELSVSNADEFDPIELYAWFLGMNINWRQRGIFLNYYMTFPIDYPKEAKAKILSSFSRGLQRSLPKSLISQPIFKDFFVEERASEPAAYAASALDRLNIEPTEEGTPYAVFDFGGGTTDFDFGLYRWADEDEENLGYEEVFEHFGSAGDKFLGGENLLENMAYLTFQSNLKICREHKITFTKPLDAKEFSGAEMFIDKTQAAQTNTLMLMSALRPLWETGELPKANNGVIKLHLLKRDGDNQSCDIEINKEELLTYLRNRIFEGVDNFYTAMKKAFTGEQIDKVHVLLAGNSSRSDIVTEIFDKTAEIQGLNRKDNVVETNVSELNDIELKQLYIDNVGELAFAQLLDVYSESDVFTYIRLFGLRPVSEMLQEINFFNKKKMVWGENSPDILVYLPLEYDKDDLYQPTCKTGVALGLLKLTPGSTTKVINHTAVQTGGQAPFAYSIGRIRRKKFEVSIAQGDDYQEWVQVGPIREGTFRIVTTQAAVANTGNMSEDDPSLNYTRVVFDGPTDGHKVFVKAISPAVVELVTGVSMEAIEQGELAHSRELSFS
ncbi:hypothetical protein [Moritella sp. Urea-trap-13]|uniref:hypothetical protein n=1 Tax=Moritella sp. Urea-trap-13 TaxID=2058327 RepID=UPI000C325AC9|nr:hypothetical protein [Moritella sp. Urea-trap-13]PKH07127.1 hypothetical protein CXF93_14770 [Moritella sp. Urea-trap-13]